MFSEDDIVICFSLTLVMLLSVSQNSLWMEKSKTYYIFIICKTVSFISEEKLVNEPRCYWRMSYDAVQLACDECVRFLWRVFPWFPHTFYFRIRNFSETVQIMDPSWKRHTVQQLVYICPADHVLSLLYLGQSCSAGIWMKCFYRLEDNMRWGSVFVSESLWPDISLVKNNDTSLPEVSWTQEVRVVWYVTIRPWTRTTEGWFRQMCLLDSERSYNMQMMIISLALPSKP